MASDDPRFRPAEARRSTRSQARRARLDGARVSLACCAAAALVLACRQVPAPSPDAAEADRRAIVGVLDARGSAAVMVMLAFGAGDDTTDTASRRAAIARAQDDVLASVDPADFAPSQRYASVPALAGVLRSERGLRQLLAHARVRRVSLDQGGSGTR